MYLIHLFAKWIGIGCVRICKPLTLSSAFAIVLSCCSVTDEVPWFSLCKSNSHVAASCTMIWYIICLEETHKISFPLHLNILYTQWFLALRWRFDFMWFFDLLHYHLIQYHLLGCFFLHLFAGKDGKVELSTI